MANLFGQDFSITTFLHGDMNNPDELPLNFF
jgi:hypothetical protein